MFQGLPIPVTVFHRPSHFPAPLVQFCHIPPRNPGALFCSAKLALRAAADASCELRFWLLRPANLVTEERLRSAVLPVPALLPASTLLRFVNPPTLLPMLLLKTPLLPELDMAASSGFWEEDATEVEGESRSWEWEGVLSV